ncbi:hypothetical protein [Kaistella sp.]|uniref:hypothetical protein n=1 Tax=Kaistella sp. TaxID=2782235 RepID=UPI0035A0B285
MENKTGNITIIAGENMAFNSEEIFFNSFSEIENQSSHIIVKNGEENGRLFGDYSELVLEDNDVKVKEYLYFNFYHTWSPTQKKTKHIGNDSIVVNEVRLIKVFKNGEELKNSRERFATDYFAHIDDWAKTGGIAYSTFYYHDSTNLRQILKKDHYTPMTEVVAKYVEGVAKYKKENRYGSPVQEQAEKNRAENNSTSMILTSSTILGTIISQIPNPYAKYGGQIIAGVSKGLKAILTVSEHADQIAIMFTLEYEK